MLTIQHRVGGAIYGLTYNTEWEVTMYDLTIQLQNDSEKCLYEQIYEHIRQEIREGKLLAGERLPSTRSLAEYLQVSRSTVDIAYAQLLSEGYIESRPYKGYFVCKMEELFQLDADISKQGEGKSRLGQGEGRYANIPLQGEGIYADTLSGIPAQKSGEKDILYDFSPNGIDMSQFPFSVWKKITKNVLSDGSSGIYALGEPQGDYELRLTISRYLHSSRGVNCSPGQIVVGAGNDYMLLLLQKILGPGRRIAMENPTYKRAYRIFKSCGYEIVSVAMDENGMKAADLEREQVTVAYCMPSHQHPTGVVMPIGRRTELLHWADSGEERYLIEDDYDSEFRYRGKPIPSLQSSDQNGRVIYIGTFSKAIAPAIRVSFMVLPPKLLQVYHEECYFFSSTVSRIDQRVLNEFIRDGYFERHLNRMRKLYRSKHELMLKYLEPFGDKFIISGENAGLHLLLTSKTGLTEQELRDRAAARQVKVYGISDSLIDETMDETTVKEKLSACRGEWTKGATVLLGYGSLTEAQIEEGIERLQKAWL